MNLESYIFPCLCFHTTHTFYRLSSLNNFFFDPVLYWLVFLFPCLLCSPFFTICVFTGADLSDYFNYGFNEDTWKAYCEKQKRLRMGLEVSSVGSVTSKITVRSHSHVHAIFVHHPTLFLYTDWHLKLVYPKVDIIIWIENVYYVCMCLYIYRYIYIDWYRYIYSSVQQLLFFSLLRFSKEEQAMRRMFPVYQFSPQNQTSHLQLASTSLQSLRSPGKVSLQSAFNIHYSKNTSITNSASVMLYICGSFIVFLI